MRRVRIGLAVVLALLVGSLGGTVKAAAKSPREALRAFNDLIGSWRATGTPEGTREERQRGFWTEALQWEWQFKGDDAWLQVAFDKGKHFARGDLRYLPDKDLYQLTLLTTGKETLTFIGPLRERVLTLDRVDEATKETQRLAFTLLHSNRFLYRYEVKGKDRPLFTRLYQVGVTKEGEPFAGPGSGQPECVVSGGLGTIKVEYKGQTYYVCCSGCRSAFKDDPEKFIKEYQARQKGKGQ
jgi:YHS domain-containing protein